MPKDLGFAGSGAFMLVHREALEQVGPLDEGCFLHGEDLDWRRRFRDSGFEVLFVPNVEGTHVMGISSQSTPITVEWHKHRGMLRYLRKFYRQGASLALLWLVQGAVCVRFSLIAIRGIVRRRM